MPEFPDVIVYRECLHARLCGQRLQAIELRSAFVLRTVQPSPDQACGRRLVDVGRIGKRLVLELDGELFVVLHLMIAGRLLWRPADARGAGTSTGISSGRRAPGPRPRPVRNAIAAFVFDGGTLWFTEAGTRKRASIHVVSGRPALAALDPGGIDPLEADPATFSARLTGENHTIKRALTDPRLISGIGNAYSDEILHRARMSPFAPTRGLAPDALERLRDATRATLLLWADRLRAEARASPYGFPEEVTAFRPEMAVHGRFGKPCPDCGAPVQRIVYAENETNYCARCQTGGVVLADRSLSRLLKASWPRSIDELG